MPLVNIQGSQGFLALLSGNVQVIPDANSRNYRFSIDIFDIAFDVAVEFVRIG